MDGTAYHPAFGQSVPYTYVSLPEDPDGQVSATCHEMIRLIQVDSRSPIVQKEAQRALGLGGGDPIAGLWQIAKQQIRFQQDEDTASQLQIDDPRKATTVEVLVRPVDQARLIETQGSGIEDCDGFVMYAGCILHSLGIPCSLVTVAADRQDPRQFSHVYLACYQDGKRIALDFSHGPYPGWECPNLGRIKEWPIEMSWGMRLLAGITIMSAAMLVLHYA